MQRPRGFGLSDLGEASMRRREAVAVPRQALAGDAQRLRITIEPDDPTRRLPRAAPPHGHRRPRSCLPPRSPGPRSPGDQKVDDLGHHRRLVRCVVVRHVTRAVPPRSRGRSMRAASAPSSRGAKGSAVPRSKASSASRISPLRRSIGGSLGWARYTGPRLQASRLQLSVLVGGRVDVPVPLELPAVPDLHAFAYSEDHDLLLDPDRLPEPLRDRHASLARRASPRPPMRRTAGRRRDRPCRRGRRRRPRCFAVPTRPWGSSTGSGPGPR